MGHLVLDVDLENEDTFSFQTNPSAQVEGMSHVGKLQGQVGEDGTISWPSNLKGEEFEITSSANYLYRREIHQITEPLAVTEIPEEIDFGTIEIDSSSSYELPNPTSIKAKDNRVYKTGWTLKVYGKSALRLPNLINNTLNGNLHYRNQNILTTQEITIYEIDGLDYENNISVTLDGNEGIKLFIDDFSSVFVDEDYETTLVWKLYKN